MLSTQYLSYAILSCILHSYHNRGQENILVNLQFMCNASTVISICILGSSVVSHAAMRSARVDSVNDTGYEFDPMRSPLGQVYFSHGQQFYTSPSH